MTIELQLWEHMQLPLFELNKDGFPRPGKVSRHYRELKKQSNPAYTQQYLATLLGVTDQWIWEIEHHDRGMDSISLRRKLARNLNIPLVLFALSSFEDEPQLGKCIKSQRKTLKKDNPLRTQQGLARALGVTEKAVREMENYDKGLDSLSRRRMLANLLKLPPTVLGIVTLEELTSQYQIAEAQSQPSNVMHETSIDIAEYQNALSKLWTKNHAGTIQYGLSMQELSARIARISAELAYIGNNQEKAARDTLCRYLQLHANIMRDQGQYDTAITELEQAVLQSEKVGNESLITAALLRLGGVFCDRGDVKLAMSHIDIANGNSPDAIIRQKSAAIDYQAAINRYTKALDFKTLTPDLRSALLLAVGNAQARTAKGNRDIINAAKSLVNQGGKIIENGKFENDEFGVRPSLNRFHVTKASTYLAAGWPNEALEVLTDAMKLPSQGDMTRMNAYRDLLWAQTYADIGSIEAAATLAQDTFKVMLDIRSSVNITRINGLYGQVRKADRSNIEVIRLGVMLKG